MKIANGDWVYEGCIRGHKMNGAQDWAYGHNRMLTPGITKLHVDFDRPTGGSGLKFKFNSFAPWNSSPCEASVTLNGKPM